MATPKWKQYEINSCNFLNSTYSKLGFKFSNTGFSNSKESDVSIIKNNIKIGSIEAKLSPSQAGQFVICEFGQGFEFSTKNFYPTNEYTRKIIEFINNNYYKYKDLSTKGISLDCEDDLLYNWVINHYKNNKKSDFIISSNNVNGYNIIIPVEDIPQYFNISATVRNKKSGSRHLPKKLYDTCRDVLSENMDKKGYSVSNIYPDNKKYILKLNKGSNLSNDDLKFYLDENELFLSDIGNNEFAIKVCSNTNNPNIVFSLKLKNKINCNLGIVEFENYLLKF